MILIRQLIKRISDFDVFRKELAIISLAMLYISCKLICNPLFFRQIDISVIFFSEPKKITCSALIYPLIYAISDLIVLLSNRFLGSLIAVFGVICDGIFSGVISRISTLPIPVTMSNSGLLNTNAVNAIGLRMWPLFYHGAVAATIAAVAEILLFVLVFKKSKNFIVSTVASVAITLIFHNIINDYQMLKHEPDVWRIIIDNWVMNVTIVFIYACIISAISYTIRSIEIYRENKYV